MTAEIAIMNRQAVALAADSAVTLGGAAKIYASANKIFALSKYRPVGVMVYGNATLLGLPWETIIKTYRKELKDRSFRTLDEYADDFNGFLAASHNLFPAEVQRSYVGQLVGDGFEEIVDEIEQAIQDAIKASGPLSLTDIEKIVDARVEEHHRRWMAADDLPLVEPDHAANVEDGYTSAMVRGFAKAFEKLPLSDETKRKLFEIGVAHASKTPPTPRPGTTGVVIAGYGTDELFPRFVETIVDGVVNDQLIGWRGRTQTIHRGMDAFVGAFAQGEMVGRFMEGVDPDYQQTIEESLDEVLRGYTSEILKLVGGRTPTRGVRNKIEQARQAVVEAYASGLKDLRHDVYVASVLHAVASLPVDELADMAESLVNLTSFKRRVSMEVESVGGPIDVAVITPGDGFIWIKRKHYFAADRNPQFFANYYRED